MLLAKSLLLLCSAVVAMARQSTSAVASGAIFVGKDTTNPDVSPVEIFRNSKNHAAAVASIVVFAANSVQFTPSTTPAKSLLGPFFDFLGRISSFPGFILEIDRQGTLGLTGSLTQLEEQVGRLPTENAALLARGIRDLVPRSIPDKTLDKWTLSMLAINKPDGSDLVEIQHVYITLTIKTDDGYNAIIPEQRAKINFSVYRVMQAVLIANAENLSEKIPIYLVPDAIHFLTSSVNNKDEIFAPTCRWMF
ncbi:hypothetical protein DFQ27_006574 [Actinomortierella ambigua]|uniref:Uncharacterized protein n=1 Tax=Actinomortierella ambigua TaxID=1343610 RepID=A0A9P6PW06_9FUNG|nr:hypothetical protein DFQ27_006574 [Actinomortierella ambigua]